MAPTQSGARIILQAVRWTVSTDNFPGCSLSVVHGIIYGQIDEGFQIAIDADKGSIV